MQDVTPLAERQEALAAQGMPALGGHRVKEGLQADWAIKRSRVPVLRGLLLLREDLQFGAQPRADKLGRCAGELGNVPDNFFWKINYITIRNKKLITIRN